MTRRKCKNGMKEGLLRRRRHVWLRVPTSEHGEEEFIIGADGKEHFMCRSLWSVCVKCCEGELYDADMYGSYHSYMDSESMLDYLRRMSLHPEVDEEGRLTKLYDRIHKVNLFFKYDADGALHVSIPDKDKAQHPRSWESEFLQHMSDAGILR